MASGSREAPAPSQLRPYPSSRRGWTLDQALAWLEGHVNLEAVEAGTAPPPGLARMDELMALMGQPQSAYPVVHVTGTNGKGSTARMLTALLGARGLAVGTYTSPDLERINERLAVAEEPVDDDALADLLAWVADLETAMAHPPSRFEILTAAALGWFADRAVDVAVVEVGLGGGHDATNVVHAQVAVVTNISLDHAGVIGPTLADIATEKSGIVKPGSILVLGETDPGLRPIFTGAGAAEVWERGREFGWETNQVAHGGRVLDLFTPGGRYPGVFLPLHGAHQGDNAACALAAAEAFFAAPLDPDVVREGFAAARSPGRMEVMGRHPLVVLDGAHNPAGARAAAQGLAEEFPLTGRRVVVMGVVGGRDPKEMLLALDPDRTSLVVACPPPSPRALPPARVAAAARSLGLAAEVAHDVSHALDRARAAAGLGDLILVTGSLYLVGEARSILTGHGGRRPGPGGVGAGPARR